MSDVHWRYIDMPDLVWAKALVAALSSAYSVSNAEIDMARAARFKTHAAKLRAIGQDDPDIDVFKGPSSGFYTVRAPRDKVTDIALAAFIQAYITKGNKGYGLGHELRPGSRKVFPRSPRK